MSDRIFTSYREGIEPPTKHADPRDFVETEACENDQCLRHHNETGHHYGCECGACMHEYWMLKR